jgi:mycobactin peptide synthetase MbtE
MPEPDSMHATTSEDPGATAAGFSRAGTVHGLFASCVRRFPQAPAVISGPVTLSYAELDTLSDGYALALEEAGIGHGDFVPVVMKSSVEMIAVVLAVMKRGAAYSAMDPKWPAARRTELITRLHPKIVITQEEGSWPAPVWRAPEAVPALLHPARPDRPAAVGVGPDDPYTLLFTSGSTGEPKCVVSPHRSTVRLFDVCDWIPMGPGAVIPQVNAVSWDGFAMDCLAPLVTGGTTVLTDDAVLVPGELSRLHTQHGVNMLYLTPSLFNVLVDEDVRCFAGLRTVMAAGETLSPSHARRFLSEHPDVRLINLYGPCECGVVATAHDVTLADCESRQGIPIGTALPYTSLYVLDGDRVCESGEKGEICIAGDALAVGYLDRADLTARAFTVIDAGGAPKTVYRTGDLGHWSADGVLHFGGRRDHQVKVRGHRIEPQDIEFAASRVPGVELTAVVPQSRDGIVDSLVLFYTSTRALVPEADVRAELAMTLPAYMVPRQVRRCERLPMLANGKIDRSVLADIISTATPVPAAPDAAGTAGPGTGDDHPRDATEALVAAVLATVLGIDSVPRTMSLFNLGADSLLAARACARLEKATGTRVTVSQFFRTPSVAGLAAWIAAAGPDQEQWPADVGDQLTELTPMQRDLLLAPIVTDLAWWFDGPVEADLIELAAGDVHRRHQALHARYVLSGPDFGRAAVPADPGRPEFRRLPDSATDAAAIAVMRDVLGEPLRLDEGRVWRCVITLSTESGRVLFGTVVHHAAFDGWSATILADDLSEAYRARRAGAEPDFGPSPQSLAESLASYQRQRAATDLEGQREYWSGEFAGLAPSQLPGRRQPTEPVGPAAAPEFTFTAEQLRPWREHARASGMQMFAWVAAVYGGALIAAGAPQDVAMMALVANRGSYQGDRTITFRMGSAFLRPNGPSRRGARLLDRMHDACARAMAAHDLLLEVGEIERAVGASWAESPVLQMMPHLLYQDTPKAVIDLGDAKGRFTPEIGAWNTSVADLCLEVIPGGAGELLLKVAMRTDVYSAELADTIGNHFARIIADGPAGLAASSA